MSSAKIIVTSNDVTWHYTPVILMSKTDEELKKIQAN